MNHAFTLQKNKPKQTQPVVSLPNQFIAAQPSCRGEVLYQAALAKPDQTQFQSRPILTDRTKPNSLIHAKIV